MSLLSLIINRKKYLRPARFNFKNVVKFLQGTIRSLLNKVGVISNESALKEQVDYRRSLVEQKSPECLKLGNCVICGCDTLDLMWSSPSCEGMCYPPLLKKSDWLKYKKQNHIQ